MRILDKFLQLRSRLVCKTAVAALSLMFASSASLAQSQLPIGRYISPVGTNVEVGNLPMNIILSPDGKFAVTSDMGFNQYLTSVDTSTGAILSQVPFGLQPNDNGNPYGLYYGLAFAPGRNADQSFTLYAGQGENQTIAVLNLSTTGTLTLTGTFPTTAHDFPSGIATDSHGNIYVANNDPDTFATATSVAIYNSAGTPLGRYTFSGSYFGTPNFPLGIGVLSDGSKAYVSSQRDGAVYVLNTSDPTNPKLIKSLATGSHPTGVLLNQPQSLLYVANSQSDTISAISTGTDTIVSTTLFRFRRLTSQLGATPVGLGLAPDGKTLYAAMGDLNAIAVANVNGNNLAVRGFIPVGWYPTGVVASPDGKRLLVTNAKGVQPLHPNPGYVQFQFNDNPSYDLNIILGTVSAVPVPSASQLATYTNEVLANNGFNQANIPIDHRLDPIGLAAGGVQHVIYVVKENRTYDQVLGDLPQGNGDAGLVLFGNGITPSLHALAQRFVLLDNFYDTGEASGDGWPWSTGSMANEYVIKNLPYNYSNRGRNYDFEGQNNGYAVAGFPAKDPYGNQLSVTFPNGAPAIPDVAEAAGGHIWDAVQKAGLKYRNYGFFYTFGVGTVIPDNYPASTGLQPAGVDLGGISDFNYRRYDAAYADSEAPAGYGCPYHTATYGHYNMPSRYSEWKREFDLMLAQDSTGKTVPAFMTVRLMHDHTQGVSSGKPTPSAEVADNDYGVGQLVQAISNSPIWQHTAIFVIEDDSQDGPDHVDSHRSTAYVISPYVKQSFVDHTFYNTDSILKTMEMLLGIGPMTQYDAVAAPILAPFDTMPSNSNPFTAVKAAQNVMCAITPNAVAKAGHPMHKLAVETGKMNFDLPDSAPAAKLNEVLWKSVKGPNSKMPQPRHSVLSDSKED